MINRRAFLATGGSALAARFAAPYATSLLSQTAANTYFAWEQLAPGVRLAWGVGVSLIVESAGESLLVDCKGYGLGTTLRREAEAGGSRPVAAVNTHHHGAQVGGNYAFTPDVSVLAHRRAGPRIVSGVEGILRAIAEDPQGGIITRRREQISREAHSDAGGRQAQADFDTHVANVADIVPGNFGPTATFGDSHSLKVGNLEVELHHFARAHTDNDVVVWIPTLNLMHVGNLLYIDAHPSIDVSGGGDTRGWQRYLRRMGELVGPETRVVCSDGGLLATPHDFVTQADYFERLRALVENALDAGMTREQTVDFIPSTEMNRFARMGNPGQLAVNLEVVYNELRLERGQGALGGTAS